MVTPPEAPGPVRGTPFPSVIAGALRILPRSLRRRWWALVPLLFLQAAVEWGAAAAIYLFLGSTGASTARERVPGGASPVLLLALLLVAKNALALAATRAEASLVSESMRATFGRLLRGYLAAPLSQRRAAHSAALAHTATDALDDAFRRVLTAAASLATEGAVVAALVAAVLVRSPVAGLVAVGVLAAALAAALRTTQNAVAAAAARRDAVQAALRRELGDVLASASELRTLGREDAVHRALVGRHALFADAHRTLTVAGGVSRPAVELVFAAGLLVAALVYPASARGSLVPILGLAAYAAFRIVPAANRAVFFVNEVRAGAPGVERIGADLARYPSPAGGVPAAAAPFRERLVLDGVTVRPDPARPPALDRVSLVLRRGDLLAVVGPSGAGKSTLLLVLAGLLAPDEGRLLADGVPLPARDRPPVGWVPQNPFFSDDTLRKNVALGLPDGEIDDGRVRSVLAAARLSDFVAALPEGLETRIGEGGSLLSGGERQRLAVARALYADPEILLLDEPTSALDLASEKELMATLGTLVPARTVVVVSHRPAAVERATRVVMLDAGRLMPAEGAERGMAAG